MSHFYRRTCCPVCSGEEYKTLMRIDYSTPTIEQYLLDFYGEHIRDDFNLLQGATYWLAECPDCGLVYQMEVPSDEILTRVYEKWIDPSEAKRRHLEDCSLQQRSSLAQEIMQIIGFFDRKPAQIRMLDYGMGWGEWPLLARGLGAEAYGFEISRPRIEAAKRAGIPVLKQSEIEQREFDFINTEQVFEHLPNPSQTLAMLAGQLADGGLIKICVPTANDIRARIRRADWRVERSSRHSLNPVAPLEHLNCYNVKSLDTLAALQNLSPVRMPLKIQYQFATHWSGIHRISRNILVPLALRYFSRLNYRFYRHSN